MKKFKLEKGKKIREIIIYDQKEMNERKELKEELEKYFKFPDCVFSFVKGKSAKEAVMLAKRYIDQYDFFVKCDINDFFPSINFDILFKILEKRINNKKLINRIKEILLLDRENLNKDGLPLGSPLSPILSNIYLYEFDSYFFNDKRKIKYLRFCDDMLFFCDENIYSEVKQKLNELKLNLNEKKSIFGSRGDSIKFLGVTINSNSVSLSNEKADKFISRGLLATYYNDIVENYDLISLIDVVRKRDEDRFISILFSLNKDELNGATVKKLSKKIIEKMGVRFGLLFEYALFENKDEIIERLIETKQFFLINEFEELVEKYQAYNRKLDRFAKLFSGRKNTYYVSKMGKREYEKKVGDLNYDLIKRHFTGTLSLAVRLDNENQTSNKLVIDIDCKENIEKAYKIAKDLRKELSKINIKSYIEFSGKKGYHLWVFFDENIEIYKLENISRLALNKLDLLDDKNIEVKPRTNYLSETENVIKLPFGFHPETMKKSIILDIKDFEEIEINKFYDGNNLDSFFQGVKENYPEPYKLLSQCCVIKNIIENGINQKKLSHFDRLLILYIFTYVDKGKEFIHFIMEHLDNYSFNITEKFIIKAPERPISCKKIREYLKDYDIVSECTCKFDLPEGVYASPVLHSDNTQFYKVSLEISIKDAVENILKLKQQRDDIDKKISQLERRLNSLFNMAGEDEVKIDIGKLKRVKEKGETKWRIDINF